MHKSLALLHSHMKQHFRTHGTMRKKVAISSLLLMQTTSFFLDGISFGWSYPVKEISKNECRKQHWSTLSADCKQQLPIIENANYSAYKNNPTYRLAYSVMRGGTYNDGWDMDDGAHEGIDIVTSEGTPLYAIEDGIAVKARAQAGYGNVVVIKHTLPGGKFLYSTYGHLSTITIPEGSKVTEGDMIGTVGHEGMAYGDHVHFVLNSTPDNTYAFRECPDLKKGEIAVANQGLCRSYLQSRTMDPIARIEQQKNGTTPLLASTSKASSSIVARVIANKATRKKMPTVALAPTPVAEKPAPTQTPTSTQKSLAAHIVTPAEVSKNQVAFASNSTTVKTASPYGAAMLVNDVTKLGEEFLQKYNLVVTPSFGSTMKVGNTSSIIITITDKNGKPYAGVLPKDITLIASENLMTLSPQVVRLTNSEGKAVILISADKAGKTDLIVSYNMKSVAKISINIQ